MNKHIIRSNIVMAFNLLRYAAMYERKKNPGMAQKAREEAAEWFRAEHVALSKKGN